MGMAAAQHHDVLTLNTEKLSFCTLSGADSFARPYFAEEEFPLVLMEPLNNELANLQRRGINAPIKTNIECDQQLHKGKEKNSRKTKRIAYLLGGTT